MSGGALAAFAVTLLVSAAAVVALMLVTFAISLAVGRNSVVDTAWGLGFALVAVVSLAMSGASGWPPTSAGGAAAPARIRGMPRCWRRRRAAARPTRCGRSS
jgi:hypothetical protein